MSSLSSFSLANGIPIGTSGSLLASAEHDIKMRRKLHSTKCSSGLDKIRIMMYVTG